MVTVRLTSTFAEWLAKLRDDRARGRIADRTVRIEGGLWGDAKFFDGWGEVRIDYGPGYRLYFTQRAGGVVFLLCGGDKQSQKRDIRRAKKMAKEV